MKQQSTENPTKYYSSRQETMIADYMGWSTVVGSGARSFHPGDVKSSIWLGECKTHTKLTDTIKIYYNVWHKISAEASSIFHRPVLFVDNGTQLARDTWCIFYKRFIPICAAVDLMYDKQNFRFSTQSCSFNSAKMQSIIGQKRGIVFSISEVLDPLVIMHLSTFKVLFGGDNSC